MTTLTTFLLAQVAADEAAARAAIATSGPEWSVDRYKVIVDGEFEVAEANVKTAVHIARHDPARVLAECASKRAIVGEHVADNDPAWDPTCSVEGYGLSTPDECPTLRHLAAPYAAEPGYDPAWDVS